jgi:CheY-like chemotaxis protein
METPISKKRIAVFEQAETAQLFLKELLGRLGYQVDCFSSLEQFGQQSSDSTATDVLIVNLSLWGDSYQEVIKHLQHLKIPTPTSVKIMALTELNLSPDAHHQLEELGISVVLPQRTHWMELLFEVNRLLFGKICELRSYTRVFGGFPIQFFHEDKWRDGIVYNISQQGAFIQCDHPPPERKSLQIRLKLPNVEKQLETQAIVNWATDAPKTGDPFSPTGIGVHFRIVTAEEQTCLIQFIASKKD